MVLSTRVWSAGKLLVLIAALLTTYLLSAFVAARFALRARDVRVPALVGASVNSASTALSDLGLSLKVEPSQRSEPKIAPGRIAQQQPAAGEPARRGRSVRVWLSSGGRVNTIPNLVGETARSAQLRVEQDGLTLAGLSEIRSDQYPPDTVVAQSPPPQSRGNEVALLINRGGRADACVMPDLIGIPEAGAASVLRSAGFRVAVVAQNPYPGVPAGIVLRQEPQAGFQVTPGDTVSLEVSR